MTDSPTPGPGPVEPDVELASAHLDGEAAPDERARAEEPEVQAQAEAFAGVADRLRDVPPPPAGLLDDQVARAMASFDDDGSVVAMGRDRGPTPWWQRIPLGAVAAALVVVALVGIASLASQGGDEDDDVATATLESADEGADDLAGGGGGSAQDSSAAAEAMEEDAALESEAGFGAGDERQAFESYEDLAADIREELAAPTGAAPAQDAGDGQQPTTTPERSRGAADADRAADPCGAVEVLGVDPAGVLLVRSVIVVPDQVTVVVHDAEDGRRLAVVDDATCTVVFDRLL